MDTTESFEAEIASASRPPLVSSRLFNSSGGILKESPRPPEPGPDDDTDGSPPEGDEEDMGLIGLSIDILLKSESEAGTEFEEKVIIQFEFYSHTTNYATYTNYVLRIQKLLLVLLLVLNTTNYSTTCLDIDRPIQNF